MFCSIWYVIVNVLDEVPMIVQPTLRPSYSGYVKSKLYSTCRRSHALNCQVTPQNKVNISAYVSREVHRLLRSFEHVVRKPVHPMSHLNEVQVARAVTLIQEGWTFRCVAVDLNISQSVIHRLWNRYDETGQFTRRFVQGRGRMTTPQDDRYLKLLCVVASFINCQRNATRLQESHWSHGV